MNKIIIALPKKVEGQDNPATIYEIHDYYEGAYYPVNEGEELTYDEVKKLIENDTEGKFDISDDIDSDAIVDKVVVAMTAFGCIACFLGSETYYKVFLPCEGIYYPIDEIEQIKDDSAEDVFVISGKIGDVEYNKDISLKQAAIHYIVSCKLKEK